MPSSVSSSFANEDDYVYCFIVRSAAGILDNNPYMYSNMFANNGNGLIRAHDHYGHTLDVHKIHYRQTNSVIERIEVAKLLLLQDHGRVAEFCNKNVSDIQLTDLIETGNDNERNAPNSSRVEDRVDAQEIMGRLEDGRSFDFEEPIEFVLAESNIFHDATEEEPKTKLKESKSVSKRKIPKTNTKVKWTVKEEDEIKKIFAKFFSDKMRPTPGQCRRAINISKSKNGLIHKRKPDVVKKKVFRMIDAL